MNSGYEQMFMSTKYHVTKIHLVSRLFFPYDETQMSTTPKTPEEEVNAPAPTTMQIIWETVRYVIIAALIIIPIRTFIAQPFIVSGNSMYPTFHNGEYLIVDELSKYIGKYRRGDVVILRYPNDPSKYFIKRVIGLPGETVTIANGEVTISDPKTSSVIHLTEPYIKNPKVDNSARTLSNEEYFVMGDNRAQSSDSRIWGPVPAKLMDGKALVRLFPFSNIGLHPGNPESFGASYK